MKRVFEFIKDKSYYFLGATVLIIVIAVAVSSCSSDSGPKSYEQIEKNMKSAAQKYYEQKSDLLPQNEGDSVRVNIGTLVEAELLNEVYDPKNKTSKCTGYVDVIKLKDNYAYTPLLNCPGNYEPEYLVDKIKNSELDEYGNGVYEMNGEYVYRGDDVNNYISFNNQFWRIIKVDKEGDIEIILADESNRSRTPFDIAYNSEIERAYGVTTDYLHTSIRKYLADFYENNFSDDLKAKIVYKDICVGRVGTNEKESDELECSVIKENEKISLLRLTDYSKASLDNSCTEYYAKECVNRNYLSDKRISTWLLTSVKDNTYESYFLYKKIIHDKANTSRNVLPVVYLSKDTIISGGAGTTEEPYAIK